MEPIKQEIINNIFENGDKLITGPILQTVLIDMIDDVNVKDQEILSKTGSWDDAVTQIPNLATKVEVTNLSESVARDLTGYATEQWVESQGYLKEHQDISNLATKTELTAAENNLQGNITSLSESVARDLANVSVPEGVATEAWVQSQDYASKSYVNEAVSSSSVDLTGYATETWVESQGYLKEHQDISNLATKTELTSVSESVQTDITNLSESVANSAVWKKDTGKDSVVQVIAGGTNPPTATGERAIATGYNTKALGNYSHAEGQSTKASGWDSHAEGFWTEAPGNDSHAEGGNTEASGNYSHAEGWYASTTNDYEHAQGQYNHNSTNQIFSVGAGENAKGTVTRRNAVSILAVPNAETQINTASFFVQNVGGYDGTNPEPGTNDLATVINNLPSGGGSSETLWKKGTGTDSIVQILTGDDEANTPTATGTGALATGKKTTASGMNSHAEGFFTNASGNQSHAEGYFTKASGIYSHAEGENTNPAGPYSHAEGFYTVTSNAYEHAQGKYNYTSSNQIFSVGAGGYESGSLTRKNAISVLVVPNSETQVVTASFFVQNVGGYDGTNPEPGTNDLATVINGMSSGGGSSETLWKKGEETDSIVQKVTDTTLSQPRATGVGAVAVGSNTNASGEGSHAEGDNTNASGSYSHAEGGNTKASGSYSHAEGTWTQALGQASHAEGNNTKAERSNSHAEGESTKASGICSHAEGYYTTASNNYSHAEGNSTLTSNEYEHAQGRYNHNSENQIFSIGTGNSDTDRRNAVSVLEVSNNNSYTSSFFVQNIGGYDGTNPLPGTNDLATVINNLPSGGSSETLWKKGEGKDSIVQAIADGTNLPTASGERAIATGKNTIASGSYSHAEGDTSIASGEASHAEGLEAKATGRYSHAEGTWTKAAGWGSHVEGSWAKASGENSHAEGYETEASGQYSHAEGYKVIASGKYSHAEGCLTSTTNWYEHAQGICNHTSTNQIFSVGAGEITNPDSPDFASAKTRRNALSVLAVPNSGSYTSSFFVQNVGGYDGTNPLPGTNDLATVLNNTETWTFTLEDGSTVTKNIRIA